MRISSTSSSFSESSSARAGGALDGRPEPCPRDAGEQVGMDRLQLLREQADVRLGAGHRADVDAPLDPTATRERAATRSSRASGVMRPRAPRGPSPTSAASALSARCRGGAGSSGRSRCPCACSSARSAGTPRAARRPLAEPLDVLNEHLRRDEPADEEAEIERLRRVGLGCEPASSSARPASRDLEELLLRPRALAHRAARREAALGELGEERVELRLRRRPDVADRLRQALHEVVARSLALDREQGEHGCFGGC